MTAFAEDHATTPGFPMRRQCPFSPSPAYAELRARGPLARVTLPNGTPAWIVTRYHEVQQVLADRRISTDITRTGFPQLTPDAREETPEFYEGEFFNMDPPGHDVYRRMMIPEFSVKRIKALRPGIQAMVDQLIDKMLRAGPRADLAEAFALQVPSLGICQLIGAPYEDRQLFEPRIRSRQLVDTDEFRYGIAEIREYTHNLVARAEQQPGDDLIGRLVIDRLATGQISHEAVVGMVLQLIIAAHETTANMIMLGVLSLLRHPRQLDELRSDSALWPNAIEELLRYHSIADGPTFARIAVEDMEIGARTIRAGDAVFAVCASANHDDRAFTQPGTLDIHRDARHHLAFGYGVHQCLGQNLARAWLEASYETLFRRIPALRLDVAVDELPFKYDAAIFGLDNFPVTW